MKHIIVNNEIYNVEVYGTDKETAIIAVWNTWNCFLHNLKRYFRHERTWDDHMGNTECGYYVNLPLPYTKKTKRFYI